MSNGSLLAPFFLSRNEKPKVNQSTSVPAPVLCSIGSKGFLDNTRPISTSFMFGSTSSQSFWGQSHRSTSQISFYLSQLSACALSSDNWRRMHSASSASECASASLKKQTDRNCMKLLSSKILGKLLPLHQPDHKESTPRQGFTSHRQDSRKQVDGFLLKFLAFKTKKNQICTLSASHSHIVQPAGATLSGRNQNVTN